MTDADRFEAFLREYEDMVFGTAVRLLGNATEAEDVAQTVFLKAFERFDQIGTSPTAAGWLKTVTTNACLNHLQRYRARWRFFSEMGPEDAEETFEATLAAEPQNPEPGSEPQNPAPGTPESTQVEHALRLLPSNQRVPIVLFHFEQKSYQDIADLLGVSLGKVKTDIHRGREALRKHLTRDHESH